jgi:hypothetical protein
VKLVALLPFIVLPAMLRADLLVSGFSSSAVYRYDENSGLPIGTNPFINTSAPHPLNQPHRVFVDAAGDLLVANAGFDSVLRYSGATGAYLSDFIAAGSGGLDYPVDMTLGPGGALYVSSQLSDAILRYDATTGAFIDTFVATGAGGLDGPSGLVFLNGELFVAGRFSNKIHRYDANGAPVGTGIFYTSGSSVFGLEIGPDNRLYAVTGNSVLRYDPALTGNTPTTFVTAGSGGLSAGIGLDFGPNDGLYVASLNTDSVFKYSAANGGSPATFVSAGAGGINDPNFLTFRSVPEPSAGALTLLGVLVLSRHGQRRRIPT